MTTQDKIQLLMDNDGYDDESEYMTSLICESVNSGICSNDNCDYITTVEPDCSDGYCEECNTNTVRSATDILLF